MFLNCVSLSSGPVRAVDRPSAPLTLLIPYFRRHNTHLVNDLYKVLQRLLVCRRLYGTLLPAQFFHHFCRQLA